MSKLIPFLTILALAQLCGARPIKMWTYQELFDQADLVIAARPSRSRDAHADERHWAAPASNLVAVITDFEIDGIMKGDRSLKRCSLYHFRFDKLHEEDVLFNPPGLVGFEPKSHDAYLMFLQKQSDGTYRAMSGQMDPFLSVIKLEPIPVWLRASKLQK